MGLVPQSGPPLAPRCSDTSFHVAKHKNSLLRPSVAEGCVTRPHSAASSSRSRPVSAVSSASRGSAYSVHSCGSTDSRGNRPPFRLRTPFPTKDSLYGEAALRPGKPGKLSRASLGLNARKYAARLDKELRLMGVKKADRLHFVQEVAASLQASDEPELPQPVAEAQAAAADGEVQQVIELLQEECERTAELQGLLAEMEDTLLAAGHAVEAHQRREVQHREELRAAKFRSKTAKKRAADIQNAAAASTFHLHQRENAVREQALHERATSLNLEEKVQQFRRQTIRASEAAQAAVQQRDAARRSSREKSWRLERQLLNASQTIQVQRDQLAGLQASHYEAAASRDEALALLAANAKQSATTKSTLEQLAQQKLELNAEHEQILGRMQRKLAQTERDRAVAVKAKREEIKRRESAEYHRFGQVQIKAAAKKEEKEQEEQEERQEEDPEFPGIIAKDLELD